MNCPKCKNPIEKDTIVCEWCGVKVAQNQIVEDDVSVTDKTVVRHKRHGFVTFWLIFMIIANIITAISNIYLGTASQGNPANSSFMVAAIGAILNVVGAISLLYGYKWGFYTFIFSAFLAAVVNIINGVPMLMALLGIAGIAVLFAILQIKKHGISAWKTLK